MIKYFSKGNRNSKIKKSKEAYYGTNLFLLNKKTTKVKLKSYAKGSYFPATKGIPFRELEGISPCSPGIISVIC